MAKEDNFITVYTGFEVNVQHLQNILEEEGIDSMVKNDSESAVRGGFGPITPGQARLLVLESQRERAMLIIAETFPEQVSEEE